jgi:hypothetical protein
LETRQLGSTGSGRRSTSLKEAYDFGGDFDLHFGNMTFTLPVFIHVSLSARADVNSCLAFALNGIPMIKLQGTEPSAKLHS